MNEESYYPAHANLSPEAAEIARLREGLEKAAATFDDLVAALEILHHPVAADACRIAAIGTREYLK